MSKVNTQLAKIFGLPQENVATVAATISQDTTVLKPLPIPAPVSPQKTELEEDFEAARENIKNIMVEGNMALKTLLSLANNSEHPRTFEVAAVMIKTLTETNKDLLALRETKIKIEQAKENSTAKTTHSSQPVAIDKAVFVGSTAELQKLLVQRDNKERDTEPSDPELDA